MSNETAFFTRLVHDLYAEESATLHVIHNYVDEGHFTFHLVRPDGASRLVRVYQSGRAVAEHLRDCGVSDQADWLLSRAATLSWLEQQGYPAPRVVRTRSGELIGQQAGWCTLMTTYFAGSVIKPTLEQLRLLGAALGHLHGLPAAESAAGAPPIGKSFWNPELAIPQALERLDFAEPRLQEEWRPLFEACRQTLRQIHQWRDRLPAAIVHGDTWPANAIQTAPDQVVLIDWDSGGSGLAVLDLGKLLLEGHLDSDLPPGDALAWHIQPDQARIHAIIDGYSQQRRLTSMELDLLLDAVRFELAFIGAIHFAYIARHGLDASLERRYARMENRYAVSQEVAALARRRFEDIQGR